jgi:hypothetical protein
MTGGETMGGGMTGKMGWPHLRGWQPEKTTGLQPGSDISANGRLIANGPVEQPAAIMIAAARANLLNPSSQRIVDLPRCRAATHQENVACKKATW